MYKGNVGFLGEMLSNFSKSHVFVLVITWPSLIQIELFKFLGKIRQSEAMFSGQFWFSSDIVLVFWNSFGI